MVKSQRLITILSKPVDPPSQCTPYIFKLQSFLERRMTRQERQQRSREMKQRLTSQVYRFTTEVITPALIAHMTSDMGDDRLVMKISPMEIYEKYGDNCARIFKLLFTLHQIGGLSKDGFAYISMWIGSRKKLVAFGKIVLRKVGEDMTPKEILEELKAMGFTESRRVKRGPEPEVLDGPDLEEYMKTMKHLRSLERLEIEYESAVYW